MKKEWMDSMVIFLSALPALGFGLACITRRWMPGQYSKSANSPQLQSILGIGLLSVSTSLIAFGILYPLLPKAYLEMVTIAFVVTVNIEAFALVFLLYRASNKAS